MRITIDTAKDSPEEIRKAIAFLQDFACGSTVSEEEVSGDTMMNMFGDTEKEVEEKSEKVSEDLGKLTPY
jgi:translation initiation factor 1 (eIF-1/SUI1)